MNSTSISHFIPVRTNHTRALSLLAAVLVSFAFIALLAPAAKADDDDDDRRGLSGTVMSVDSTSLRVAVRSGLKTVFVDADTTIRRGKENIELSDVTPGDRISAQLEPLIMDQLLATKIKVRGKTNVKKIEHLTGVVVERTERSFMLTDRTGRSVEVEVDDDEVPEVADVVTTIVEADLRTGRREARQVDKVEKIVERLENSLSKQFDKARANVVKRLIDESARQHLNTLNQTLDEVEADTKVKIEAALTKFRTDYAAVAERVGNAPPEETYTGTISEITGSTATISSSTGAGSRTFTVVAETQIIIDGAGTASTVDLSPGQSVAVSFVPVTNGDPVAIRIEVLPPALPPVVVDTVEDLSDGVIEGDITVVETDQPSDSTVIIVEENGSGDTIGVEVTDSTTVTVDGSSTTADQLAADQTVEVTVGDDGITAETVVASSQRPPEQEVNISGVVSATDPDRRVIVVTPPAGEPVRLEVRTDAVVTINGVPVPLSDVSELDIVLDSSRHTVESLMVTRLSIVRPSSSGQQTSSTESSTPDATPGPSGSGDSTTPESVTTQPFSVTGFLKSFDGDFIVLDGMSLPKSSGFSLPAGVTAGSQVNLMFTVAENGDVVLTGIQAP